MKNHPLYKKLKQIALDGQFTVEQAASLTFKQAVELLDTNEFSGTFLTNMKRGIVMALQNRDDLVDVDQLKQEAKRWLNVNKPGWEAERGREGGKPYVTIWLEGKPER